MTSKCSGLDGPDRGAAPAAARDGVSSGSEEDADLQSMVASRLAEILREDISLVGCLSCTDEGRNRDRVACPCFATLHPFCDLFHTWLCHRLIDDGVGTCCLLPAQVIVDPQPPEVSELEATQQHWQGLTERATPRDVVPAADESDGAAASVGGSVEVGGARCQEGDDAKSSQEQAESDNEASTESGDSSLLCDATRFHTDSDSDGGSESGDDGYSEAEEGPTDPLTMQLRTLAETASEMVHSLEKHVGKLSVQRRELRRQLAICVDLTTPAQRPALEEIIEWYSVLSILACSFPTQKELHEHRKKKEKEGRESERQQSAPLDAAKAIEALAVLRAEEVATAEAEEEPAPQSTAARPDDNVGDGVAALGSDPASPPLASDLGKGDAISDGETEGPALEEAKQPGQACEAEDQVGEEKESGVDGKESEIINSSLEMPPLLLRSSDIGQPLRPVFLGAATEKDAGQWYMGLQARAPHRLAWMPSVQHAFVHTCICTCACMCACMCVNLHIPLLHACLHARQERPTDTQCAYPLVGRAFERAQIRASSLYVSDDGRHGRHHTPSTC